jgi:hypothetical protein
MGNKQATGGEPSLPRMMLSTTRNTTLVVGPKINESDKSGITKTSEVGSIKPRAERETWGQSTHKDRLSIVNITRKQENQYLVEMADGSTYLGGLEQSQFSGYGEVEWKSTKKR